jgi:copper chaperone NosL
VFRSLFQAIERFLARPLNLASRLCLLLGVVCLIGTFFFPLWQIRLVAPQYRDGLDVFIYSYKLEGGRDGIDLREINILNHYIGMRPLEEADFVEMQVIPFVLGLLILLALRAIVFGRMSNLVDLFVLFTYFGIFSLITFYYRLYTYGTDLNPRAAMTIEPFVPALIGSNRIANFVQYSFPHVAGYLLLAFGVFLALSIFLSRREEIIPLQDPHGLESR